MPRLPVLGAAALLAALPLAARGAEPDDVFRFFQRETVVRAATRTEERAEDAPSVVTVIDQEGARRLGLDTVGELLGTAAGFHVFSDWVADNVGVRGVFGGARAWGSVLKVMIDGRDTVFRPYGTHFVGPELIPSLAIERVEVVRGPLSALYGADAFLGVVDVVTRRGADVGGVEARAGAAAIREGQAAGAQAIYGDAAGAFDWLGGVSYHREARSGLPLPASSPRFRQFTPRPEDGGVPRSHGDTAWSLGGFLRGAARLGPGRTLELDGSYSRIAAHAAFLDYGVLNDDNAVGLHQVSARARYEEEISPAVRVDASAGAAFAGPTDDNVIDVGSTDQVIVRRFSSSAYDAAARVRLEPWRMLAITAGGDYLIDREVPDEIVARLRRDTATGQAGQERPITPREVDVRDLQNGAGFLQVDVRPLRALRLIGGLRLDAHSIYGTRESYRAGLVAQGPARTFAKLLYGTAFKAPTPLQLYGRPASSIDQRGNPELRPQQASTAEGVVGIVLGERRAATVSATVFRTVIDDQVEYDFRSRFQAFNVARSEQVGVEVETNLVHRVGGTALGPLELRASANLTALSSVREFSAEQAAFKPPEDELFPTWMGRVGASAELPLYRWLGFVRLDAASERTASLSNISLRLNQEPYALPGWFDVSAGTALDLYHRVGGQVLRLEVEGQNLLQARDVDPGYGGVDIPARGRSVSAALTYTY